MNIQKRLRRIAKLGITNFETMADIERLQRDLLRRLERSSIDPRGARSWTRCMFASPWSHRTSSAPEGGKGGRRTLLARADGVIE